MSTLFTIISFPFWFFGLIFFGASVANQLTLSFDGVPRKAKAGERVLVGAISLVLIVIAYVLTVV